jgi:alcohol dehydrogenase class IV
MHGVARAVLAVVIETNCGNRRARVIIGSAGAIESKTIVLSHTREVQMTQQGEEVLKEFVRRVNALLDRLQKVAGLEEGAMNQADLDVLAVASVELLTNTLANMPEPMRSDRLKAFSETLAADVAKKRERIEQSIRKGSA